MRKGGWMRALGYFIRQAELTVLFGVAGGFVMAIYICLLQGNVVGFHEIFSLVPDAVIYFVSVILFTYGSTSFRLHTQVVSFGCLRKYAFWGNLVMHGLVMTESLLFWWLMTVLMRTDRKNFIVYLAIFFAAEGCATLFDIAVMKWGKAASAVMIVMIALFSGWIGFFSGYGAVMEQTFSFLPFHGMEQVQVTQWMMLAVGVLLCIAANAGSWQIIRKLEVRT